MEKDDLLRLDMDTFASVGCMEEEYKIILKDGTVPVVHLHTICNLRKIKVNIR